MNVHVIDGYRAIHSCRQNRRDEGMSIYIKQHYSIADIEIVEADINVISVEVCNLKGLRKLQTIGVYRPPERTNYEEAMKLIESLVIQKTNENVMLVGDQDINVHHDNIDNRAEAKEYLNFENTLGLHSAMILSPEHQEQ